MKLILLVLGGLVLIQCIIYLMTKKNLQKDKAESVLVKYRIKSTGDAWRVMNDLSVPLEDREKIEAIYNDNKVTG